MDVFGERFIEKVTPVPVLGTEWWGQEVGIRITEAAG